ncbi:hypothetical protein BD414DRAFT_490299 [Trametes punicea]|nr:hypothetical protein BD414DRAFT_490299 [Trametes punicea]
MANTRVARLDSDTPAVWWQPGPRQPVQPGCVHRIIYRLFHFATSCRVAPLQQFANALRHRADIQRSPSTSARFAYIREQVSG